MNFLSHMFGRPRPPAFSRRKEWEKLKSNLEGMHWHPGAMDETAHHESNGESNGTTCCDIKAAMVGTTRIKEIAGIIENKLRVFGLESPRHFTCQRHMENDEYAFRFTDSGIDALARKGIKIAEKKPH